MKQQIIQPHTTIKNGMETCTDNAGTKWETIWPQICYIIPVKLRSFYFKIIHRALPCNYTLYEMKITPTDYSVSCYNIPQTIMQRFLECPTHKNYGKNLGPCFYIHSRKY